MSGCGCSGGGRTTIVYHDGKSAYELWLEQGHTGTIDDFFEWLRGPEGKSNYDVWLEENPGGTFDEWMAAVTGPQGLSAYEVWLEDNPGQTEADFFAFLKGKMGDPGASVESVTVTATPFVIADA